MSLRRADLRFALPQPARAATVLGGLSAWEKALEEAGLSLGGRELVVAPAALASEALALQPATLLLEGRARLPGWSAQMLLPLPTPAEPELVLPAGRPGPVRYAIRGWRPGASPAMRARNAVAREALARGLVPPGRATVTAASRRPGLPFFVAAANRELGLGAEDWFASFGPWPQRHSRGAFFLFLPGEPEPAWVLKFARLPGLEALFERDERGLQLVERSAVIVKSHAPLFVGRLEVDGLHASVETAATGRRLPSVLGSRAPRAERLKALERVAEWLLRIGMQTKAPPDTLEPERRRLAGVEGLARFVEELPPVPAVFQHGDVGGDNVVLRGETFTVVDWESAREHGLPLWDLFYLLTGGLALLDGLDDESRRDEHFVDLWRGDLPSSDVLFRWTRRAAEALGVPQEAVGRLATLLWLSYAAEDAPKARGPLEPATVRFARRWLEDPALGSGWDRWR
jgi:hypothetical protein